MATTARTPAPAPTPEPTLEQYRLAYRQLSRPGWPSFDACMQDHVRRTCLAGIARNMGRARWSATVIARGLPQGQPVPATPTAPPAPHAKARQHPLHGPGAGTLGSWPRTLRGIDGKRAAANDTDD